jgi:hypothetical protein
MERNAPEVSCVRRPIADITPSGDGDVVSAVLACLSMTVGQV